MTSNHPPDLHLDLGCGAKPRNPYRRARLCGVDIRKAVDVDPAVEIRVANLALQPIPYATSSFGSVSAFDFIEHVPRVLADAQDEAATTFPFVNLMNEIWRVLAPGGLFYALTPCYPAGESFQDPTHVNIITERTHHYFAGRDPWARMYGYVGQFQARRAEWACWRDAFEPLQPLTLKQRWRRFRYRRSGRLTHFIWEFECIKPAAPAAPTAKPRDGSGAE
jgi:SAM-dependent methyltransferase